jgi:hypothetical protein
MLFDPTPPPKHRGAPDYRRALLLFGWAFAGVVVFAAIVWVDRLLQPRANLPAAGMAVLIAVAMYVKR